MTNKDINKAIAFIKEIHSYIGDTVSGGDLIEALERMNEPNKDLQNLCEASQDGTLKKAIEGKKCTD